MKRWYCPRCGVGKLNPARMAEDDVRRYCLSCSEKTGRLVRRWVAGTAKAAEHVQWLYERAEAQKAERLARAEQLRKAKAVIYHQRGMCLSSKGTMVTHVCAKPLDHKGKHDMVAIADMHAIKKRYELL